MLNESQAVDIYLCKLSLEARCGTDCSGDIRRRSMRGKCGPVSKMFGVSPRIVRDIWNRHTWGHATAFLWEQEQTGSIKSVAKRWSWVVADTVDETKQCHENAAQGTSQISNARSDSNAGSMRIAYITQESQTIFGTDDPEDSRCQLFIRNCMVDISIAALTCQIGSSES